MVESRISKQTSFNRRRRRGRTTKPWLTKRNRLNLKRKFLSTTGELNISNSKQVCVSGVDKVVSGKELHDNETSAVNISTKVRVPGVFQVGEETGKWSDVRVTPAGIFYISSLEKVCVDSSSKKNEKKRYDCQSLKRLLEELDDDFQPEIVNVCTEQNKQIKSSVESSRNIVTIKKNWNSGCVTSITHSKVVFEPAGADNDDVVFLEERLKSK